MRYMVPLFSIVTPSYNSEKTIRRTIESVMSQNLMDYEYIVVDGGSTDITMDIVKSFEPEFKGRLKYISEKDEGIYDAFNKGIKMAHGQFIWIVNSDDYIESDALSYLSQLISEHADVEIISAVSKIVTKDGIFVRYEKHDKENASFCYMTNGMGVTHPATIVKKTVYDRYGAYDARFKICADIDWFNRIYRNGVEIKFVDKVITNMQNDGISNRFNYFLNAKDRILLYKKKYNNILTRIYFFLRWSVNYLRTNLFS